MLPLPAVAVFGEAVFAIVEIAPGLRRRGAGGDVAVGVVRIGPGFSPDHPLGHPPLCVIAAGLGKAAANSLGGQEAIGPVGAGLRDGWWCCRSPCNSPE